MDGSVRAYDLIKYKNFRTMTSPKPTQFTCVATDYMGDLVCAGGFDPYSIYVWSIKTGDLLDILSGHTAPITSLAFSPSLEPVLVSGSWDNTAKVWDFVQKGS